MNDSLTSMPLGGPSSPLLPLHHFDIIGLFKFNRSIDRSIKLIDLVVIVRIGMM
jgi:hypothetical protein